MKVILGRPTKNIMAELDVQPKKKSPIPWIIGIIIVMIILYFVLNGGNETAPTFG